MVGFRQLSLIRVTMILQSTRQFHKTLMCDTSMLLGGHVLMGQHNRRQPLGCLKIKQWNLLEMAMMM